MILVSKNFFSADNYMSKVNNRNTRKRCEICSKLTIKIPERRHWRRTGIFIVKACACYFLSKFYFSPNDSPLKAMKLLFISSWKLFSFSRYSIFCVFVFYFFSHCQPLFERLIQEKSQSLWCHQLSKYELNNTFCMISWERNRILKLKLCPLIEN